METKKRTYISGPITGDPDARERFRDAERSLIEDGGLPVNPFDNGLADESPWQDHMIADIRMLMSCDAIFMLKGWNESKGARMEFHIAEEMGMEILFESKIERDRFVGAKNDRFANMMKAAIREVMGTDFDQHLDRSRSQDVFFMRMIFTYHCREFGMTLKMIKAYIHRDHTTMLHYLKRYKDEYRFNPQFRTIADNVSLFMHKFVSH